MKKLINYLKRNNINYELTNSNTLTISFDEYLKAEIKTNKISSQNEYKTTLIYKNECLFKDSYSANLKEMIKNISYLKSLLNVYNFDKNGSYGLVYFNSIYKPVN